MGKRFDFGELNPNIVSRTGITIDPQRFNTNHLKQKILEQFTEPSGFKTMPGPLMGIVLRIEQASSTEQMGKFFGLNKANQQPLVRIKVRIPELHPFPDPEVYGPEGPDGIISLYPTFVAINPDIPTPAVGEIVYVDYRDRENLEDPQYFGQVFSKPILGGVNEVKEAAQNKLSSLFDAAKNELKDFIFPPSNVEQTPVAIDQSIEQDIPRENQKFSIHPVSGRITSFFGSRTNPATGKKNTNHNGIDYGTPVNTPVVSIGEGIVEKINNDIKNPSGKFIIIKGVDEYSEYVWSYSHLNKISVKEKDEVVVGQKLGLTGQTGLIDGKPSVTGPHLHFVIKTNPKTGSRVAVDPIPLLPIRK